MPESPSHVHATQADGRHHHERDLLLLRIRGQFEEMPHLRLTAAQAGRLFGLPANVCARILAALLEQRVLWRGLDGRYALRGL